MNLETYRKNYTREYTRETIKILESMTDLDSKISKLCEIFCKARDEGKTIYFMGNGGSASTASHFVVDISKCTIDEKNRVRRFKCVSLSDNIPTMLAWANDVSYEEIFIEQLKTLMNPGDVVVGISGSGNSKNVVKAMEYAKANGAVTIGLTGMGGGKLGQISSENIIVPSNNMQHIEDIHLIILHLLTSILRDEVKGEG